MDSDNPAEQAQSAFTDTLNRLVAQAKADPAQKHFICYQVGELKSWVGVQIEQDGAFRFWHCNSMKRAAISPIKEAIGQFIWDNQHSEKQPAWADIDQEDFIKEMISKKWFNEPILTLIHNAMYANHDVAAAIVATTDRIPFNMQDDEGIKAFLEKEIDDFSKLGEALNQDRGKASPEAKNKKENVSRYLLTLFGKQPKTSASPQPTGQRLPFIRTTGSRHE